MDTHESRTDGAYGRTMLERILPCMVQSAAVPIIIVNRQGHIIFFNEAYEKWSGLTQGQAIGRHITEVVENTRTHITAVTGKADLQQIQKCFGKVVLSNRLPIFDENHELLGAWGIVDVNDISGITALSRRIGHLEREITKFKNELRSYQSILYTFNDIIGNSASILTVKEEAQLAAQLGVDVLISGGSGTGKELFAHAIHSAGSHNSGPFISVNCSFLPMDKIEVFLFGGRMQSGGLSDVSSVGKVEAADEGTLFLDEIGDLPFEIQPQILQLIEQRRIPGTATHPGNRLNLQIIASTNHDLKEMVRNGVFRADLYYALTSFTISLPPLRERQDDIPELIDHFIDFYADVYCRKKKSFTPSAVKQLIQYEWPGNIRELSNFVKNSVIRTPEDALAYTIPNQMSQEQRGRTVNTHGPLTVQGMEAQLILSALKETKGNVRKSAVYLGMDRNTLYRKLKKYGIDYTQFRSRKN